MNAVGHKFFDFLYKYGTLITILLLIVVFGASTDNFLNGANIVTILRSISIVTIIAIGLTVSLAVGGFDLSIGSTASLANAIVISMFVWYGQSVGIGIAVAIVFCLVVGLVNAFLVINFKIQDMLMTLATMFVFQGIALTYTRGATISENMILPSGDYATGEIPDAFGAIGKVPWIIVIMLIVVLAVHLFLTYTKHGRYMYMIGGNPEAAKLSGIAVGKYRLAAYLISALFAGIGGIVLGARVMNAEVNAGAPYFDGRGRGRLHRLLRLRRGQAERVRHVRRRGADRHLVQRPHHAVRAVLRDGYRQRLRARSRPRDYVLQKGALT